MLDLAEVSKLIVSLLASRSPEFGARLKQRLNALLRERNLEPFDERQYGFRKFQDFLEKGQGDVVEVIRTEGGGDIRVVLKGSQKTMVDEHPIQSDAPKIDRPARPIRSDVWQAFANPDPERRRFLDRQTYQICHFISNHQSDVKNQVERNPSQYVEIAPITTETHKKWMRDFLDAVPITGVERTVLEQMLDQAYTSALNAAFTRSLASNAGRWKEHRVKLVLEAISLWAQSNKLDIDRLRSSDEKLAVSAPGVLAVQSESPSSARQQTLKLLELVSEEDIGRVVLPVLLSTILIKARL